MAKVQVAKAILSVCTVHRQRWILYWRPVFHQALTVQCGVGAFFRTYVANRNRPHYLRNFAAHKTHFFQIFPNDLYTGPSWPRSQYERQDSDHFGKNLEKNGKLFPNDLVGLSAAYSTRMRRRNYEIFWKKFSKSLGKIFQNFFQKNFGLRT